MMAEACEEGVRVTAVTLDDGTGKISEDFIEYAVVFKRMKSALLPDDEEKMVIGHKTKNNQATDADGKLIWIPRPIFQEMQCRANNFLFPKKESHASFKVNKTSAHQQNLL
ncbi:MAG: hypothetical protein A3B16_00995 [Candidatus Zambryskibacteria bacterium RIFCSPLOWO2_01_FULL_45_43]|nr:MAG: hypothetical protein A3B16_00995 [Candidatus Zambryskibacteria bacterium RIFCSPLOWO2_01_FULL_45_43]